MGFRTDPETEAKIRAAAGLPPIDPGEGEAEFQRRVIRLAKRCGWAVVWLRPVRILRSDGTAHYETPVGGDGAGFTDLILVRNRVIFAELKTNNGVLRANQEKWIERLREAGAVAVVWRPCMWAEIMETLK